MGDRSRCARSGAADGRRQRPAWPTRGRAPGLAACCLLALAAQPAAPAQEGAQQQPERLVLNQRVEAHWLPDGRRFWYRRQTAPGRSEFMLVDAVAATRAPAFDHRRLADALGAALGRAINAGDLPVELLDDAGDPRVQLLSADQRWWEWDDGAGRLHASERRGGALPIASAPHPSRDGGAETWLLVRNRSRSALALDWVTPEGGHVPYGSVPPDGEVRMRTFAGHVWEATAGGHVLGVVEARAGGGEATFDGTRPAPAAAPPADPNRSPDGRWQAEARGRELWLRPLPDGEPVLLGRAGTGTYATAVAWAPDSRHLAALAIEPGDHRTITLVESSPSGQLEPKACVVPYPKPGDRIDHPRPHLFALAERRELALDDALFPTPWSIDELRWEPDGSAFTFAYNERGHQRLRIISIAAATGAARAVVDERSATFIDYAGKRFCDYLDATHELIWMSERDGWNHLYLYDAATGAVKNRITSGSWAVRSVERVDPVARRVWFRAGGLRPGQDPYLLDYARIDLDGGGLTVLTRAAGEHRLDWSPDRRFAIDTWSRIDAEPVSELIDGEGGGLIMTLEHADASALRMAGWLPPEPAVAKGRDGVTDIYGAIWRPRHFDPQRRYPVVECIYAGPQAAHVPKRFAASSPQQRLADEGFMVVMVDAMGTSYRSKAFHDVCWRNLGDAGLPDRIPWIKAAAATRPFMDLARIGIYGTSAGGQNALRALLMHPEFYRAAVADCGCHDNRMDKMWWNELWMGWPVGPHYAEQSNVVQAHLLEGRLLLMVGELDDNVDPSSTMQVADALIKAGKDFELLVAPGVGHGVLNTPYGWRRMVEFLRRSLP